MNKLLLTIFSLIFISQVCFSQKDSTTAKPAPKIKQFWMVILKTGPKDKEITDTAQRNKIFAGHFANMERLYQEGFLKAAGPFGKNDFAWRGLFIFDCTTREDAQALVATDPGVAASILIVEIVPWYSQATGSFVPGKPPKEN
ncbi:MAG: YciI family protein [Chitinophagaceae bacterium]